MTRKAMDAQSVERERLRILAQARLFIEQDGFKYLSMRKLAAKLGVTATTIYHYFSSKDDLFLSLLVVGFDRLYTGMTVRIGEKRYAREMLKAVIEEYIRFGIEEKGYYNIMFASDYPECRKYTDPREADEALEAQRISLEVVGLFSKTAAQASDGVISQERITHAWVMMHGFVSLFNSGMLSHMADDVAALREGVAQRVLDLVLAP